MREEPVGETRRSKRPKLTPAQGVRLGLPITGLYAVVLSLLLSLSSGATLQGQPADDFEGPLDTSRQDQQPNGDEGRETIAAETAGRAGGAEIYGDACAACHGVAGGGGVGPALSGNPNVARSDYLLALILTGGDGMPAFHARLTEGEIVTVANHVRTSWGNGFEPVEPALLAAQWWQGAEDEADLYRRVCARCHGTEGGGKIGPPLAGNDNLADGQYVAGKILHGQGGMPAFEGILGLRTISALASHIRRSFGNDFGAVELELVRALATAEPGELRVSVVPEHSRLAILGPDGYRRFVTSAGHESLPGLEPGTYGITASKAGYRAAAGVARVRSGEVSGVLLRLEPISLAEDEAGRASRSRTLLAARPQLGPGAENRNGRKWYQASCALCHGPAGQGGVGPPLAGNGNVEDLGFVIQTILNGSGRMPAFADRLTDEPIAAIAYFERTSWGNEFGVVSEEQVAEQRVRADGAGNGPSTRNSANQIYQANCSICHGGVGGGGAGPPLAANRNLADLPYVISRIVMGGGGMPPFNQTLSSSDIAQVTSLIRNSWGNDYGSASLVEAQNYHGGPSSLTP